MFACKACEVAKPAPAFRVHKRGYRIGKCRDCENDYQRQWYMRDPEKIRRRKRESMARRRAADPEAARAKERAWDAANRDRRRASARAYLAKRFFYVRVCHLRGSDRANARDLWALWHRQRGRCALTGRRLNRAAQLDHILPKARGGGDNISNLRWVCQEVNLAKRDLTDAELVALCVDVMSWIGERIARALGKGAA